MNALRRISIAAATIAASTLSASAGPLIDAPAGKIEGTLQGAIRVFKGIPYALPPVGPLRFTAPAEPARWQGVRKATAYGHACMQPTGGLSNIYSDDPGPQSEDCLTLNIWAPADAKNAPVLFWIHGGALVGGSSREGLYDGARLASRGVIVVTVNYRLGVFGYLAHPELSAESPLGISGNWGLLDQIAALQWVHGNIAAFGGDPANVTIAGQSAGALSVMYLMASPSARGLFAKAIAQSAYMISTPELKQAKYGSPSSEQIGAALTTALKVPNIAALRKMDAENLTKAAAAAKFSPFGTIDGHILPRQLVDVFDRGEQAPVPLLAGFNSGEVRSIRVLVPLVPSSADAYQRAIRERYQDLADDFLKLYPATNMPESLFAITRDALYGWTAERLVKKQTALGQPAFYYVWDHGYPAADSVGLHGFHASELPYLFGDFNGVGPHWPKVPETPPERTMSDMVMGYWTGFARSGKPESAGAPPWPAYGSTASVLVFQEVPKLSQHLMPGMVDLIEKVVCRRHASGDQAWNWNVGLWAPKIPPKTAACN